MASMIHFVKNRHTLTISVRCSIHLLSMWKRLSYLFQPVPALIQVKNNNNVYS